MAGCRPMRILRCEQGVARAGLPGTSPNQPIQAGFPGGGLRREFSTPRLESAAPLEAGKEEPASLSPVEFGRSPYFKILDFSGFDTNVILILRGGILMSIGYFPESLSQEILAGIILVGRLVGASPVRTLRARGRSSTFIKGGCSGNRV